MLEKLIIIHFHQAVQYICCSIAHSYSCLRLYQKLRTVPKYTVQGFGTLLLGCQNYRGPFQEGFLKKNKRKNKFRVSKPPVKKLEFQIGCSGLILSTLNMLTFELTQLYKVLHYCDSLWQCQVNGRNPATLLLWISFYCNRLTFCRNVMQSIRTHWGNPAGKKKNFFTWWGGSRMLFKGYFKSSLLLTYKLRRLPEFLWNYSWILIFVQ